MINNKKAYLRIVEAFVAILLISGVLLFIVKDQNYVSTKDLAGNVEKLETTILRAVSENITFRSQILNGQISDDLNNFVNDKKPSTYEFQLAVCELTVACPLPAGVKYPNPNKEVYSSAIAITSNITVYQPKQLKIFMWKKD